MKTRFWMALGAAVLLGRPVMAQGPAEVTLSRIDCGSSAEPRDVGERFSDTFAHKGLKLMFVYSCYLIQHGEDYMVWDAGFAPGSSPNAPKIGIVDHLKEANVSPERVKYIGVSHYHGDHTGQLEPFAGATLLIGKGDWDAVTVPSPAEGVNAEAFAPWTKGGGAVEPLTLDKDVFGDGTVIVLRTPGHTPGHSSLLVRLKEKGPVLLTGDLAHFRENLETNGVPSFNVDRAQTLASLERFKEIADNLNATIVIQHDLRDVDELPAFPAAAK